MILGCDWCAAFVVSLRLVCAVCSRLGGESAMPLALHRCSGRNVAVVVLNLSDSDLREPSGTILGTCTYLKASSVVATTWNTIATNCFAFKLE